jgi:LEA14-like dessication related protein
MKARFVRCLSRLTATCAPLFLLASCAALQPKAEPPEIRFEQFRLVSTNIQTQRYAVKLSVFNPNRFDVPIRDLVYNLDLDGEAFASGRLDPGPTLPARQEIPVELMFETNLANSARRAIGWFLRGQTSVEYRLTGEARVQRIGVPAIRFEESGSVALDALRLPRQ